jgi:subfamily B ATP-binding cassette protein MsbA
VSATSSTAAERPGHALHVVRRLLRRPGVRLWPASGAVAAIVGEGLVYNGVISVLLALIFLSVSPSARALGRPEATDWIQRLHWVRTGSPEERVHSLLLFSGALIVAWFVKDIFTFGSVYLSQRFAQGVIRSLRQELYDHLLRQSIAFHRSRRSGDLLSRVSNDVAVLQRLLGTDLADAIRGPVTVVIALAIMFSLEWRLTLLALVCVPGISVIIARSGERLRRLAHEVQQRLGVLNAFLHERLGGMETVQVFGMEARESQVFGGINEDNYRANVRAAAAMAFITPAVEFFSAFGMVILVTVAGYLAIQGPLSLPTLLAFAYVGQNLGSRLGLLGKIWLSMQQSAAAGDRIFEILDTRQEVPETPGARPLPRVAGEIRFDRVGFRYRDGEPVLRDISMTIPPGQVVALVGASGAGKTSLANLIPRFYEPTEGRIEIDGIDVRTVTLQSLRAQVGVVPQEPILFSGSIGENICYGRPGATAEQMCAAARAANAEEFISALARGYDTSVGERAAQLSGGQRQRIAIARTLLRDPRLLILDEATSALDSESEALVQHALDNLMQGRTTLVIAHRLSTIQRADRVLVLSGGAIVEDGTHAELMRAGGVYRRLYESQLLSPQQEAPAPS